HRRRPCRPPRPATEERAPEVPCPSVSPSLTQPSLTTPIYYYGKKRRDISTGRKKMTDYRPRRARAMVIREARTAGKKPPTMPISMASVAPHTMSVGVTRNWKASSLNEIQFTVPVETLLKIQ